MIERAPRIGVTPYLDDQGAYYVPKGYLRGIERIGGTPVMIPYETPEGELDGLSDSLDGMLFSGGDDVEPARYGAAAEPETEALTPLRDALEIALLGRCLERHMPVLGICRGCQIINVALGGTLVQHVPRRFGAVHQMAKSTAGQMAHMVHVAPQSRLYRRTGGDFMVNSYHHQCVDRLADTLTAVAWAPEGFVEAYEWAGDGQYLTAVQWHPEITQDNDRNSALIFEDFGEAVFSHMER